MKNRNTKKFTIIVFVAIVAVFTSCEDTYEPSKNVDPVVSVGDDSNGLYLGIIGFNESLTEKALNILTTDNSTDYMSFIDGLQPAAGTVLYHAVNKSLDNITAANLPNDIVNVSVVTFTDGLDLGSYILNSKYNSGNEYLQAVNGRIKNDTVKGVAISAYAIGIRGDDVTDIAQFTSNIRGLSSNANNAMEINNISEATGTFREIASSLSKTTNKQLLELTIPAPNPDTKIRFTLDPVSSASNSKIYIEGIFSVTKNVYYLSNIVYNGIACASGDSVSGTASGIKFTFAFEDIKRIEASTTPNFDVKQWSYITSNKSWQINSEFNQIEDTETIVENSSAAIFLVLDCSSSLGDDFNEMRKAAKSFIDVLLLELE